MTLSIVTACIGRPEITEQFLQTTIKNCESPHDLVVVSNGSTDEENRRLEKMLDFLNDRGWATGLIVTPDPMGTSCAFNSGISEVEDSVVVVLQNDLLVLQSNWDTYIQQFFDSHPEAGVVGFAGGKRLGDANLYHAPYEVNQLARGDVFTSLDEWHIHGQQTAEPIQVAVLDGIAMAMRKSDWDAWGGYDEHYRHHMYDIDLSLTAHFSGRRNYVVPILCKHLNGQSVSTEVYAKWAAPYGGDPGIHAKSHKFFYEKWRGRIPVSV